MKPLSPDPQSDSPITGISAQDALLLAIRRCVWLIVLPLAVTLIVSVIYMNLPSRASATAVLNVNVDLFNLYAAPALADLPASVTVSTVPDNGTVMISVETSDAANALSILQHIIDVTPEPEIPMTLQDQIQSLELRALLQYRRDMQQRLGNKDAHSPETAAINGEIEAINHRITYLENRAIDGRSKPKIALGPLAADIRRPPPLNVAIFALFLTLFFTWAAIYKIEHRRIVRERGVL